MHMHVYYIPVCSQSRPDVPIRIPAGIWGSPASHTLQGVACETRFAGPLLADPVPVPCLGARRQVYEVSFPDQWGWVWEWDWSADLFPKHHSKYIYTEWRTLILKRAEWHIIIVKSAYLSCIASHWLSQSVSDVSTLAVYFFYQRLPPYSFTISIFRKLIVDMNCKNKWKFYAIITILFKL